MTPSTPSFSWISAPTVSPGPMTRLKTPSGMPAARTAWSRHWPEIGASELGL